MKEENLSAGLVKALGLSLPYDWLLAMGSVLNIAPQSKTDVILSMHSPLDAKKTRPIEGGASFSIAHRALRTLWFPTWLLLASWTPPFLHPWRRFLLRCFGAKMGKMTDVRGSARVWYPPNLVMQERAMLAERVNCYNMATVSIGRHALVSQGAHLCAGNHLIDDPSFQLITKPITIDSQAWVAADAFVAPGVTIGEGAVLGARGVALCDLNPWMLYIGNPATPKRSRKNTKSDSPEI